MTLPPEKPPAGKPSSPTPGPIRLPTSAALPRVTMLPFGPVVLAVMGLVAVILVGAIVALGRVSGGGATVTLPQGETGPATDVVPRKPEIDVLDPAELAVELPEETRDELQQELTEWFRGDHRRPIDDRSGEDETEWVSRLLSDDVLPRLERLPGHVFGALPESSRVLHEPGPHRGLMVTVWGRVASVDPVSLPSQPSDATAPETPAWRVRIDDEKGEPWTVTSLREPPASVAAGKWARAFGVFTKLYPVEGKRPSFGLFAPAALAPSFPPFDATEIDPAWGESVKDGTLEDSQRRPGEEDAFWRLCAYAQKLGTDGYRAKVASGAIEVLDVSNSRALTDFLREPVKNRFRAVRVRGAPLHGEFGVETGFDENAGHVRALYRGFVADDLHRPVWVAAPFPASAFSFSGARLVEVQGFFYKRIATEGKTGNRYWLPVIVATSIEPVSIGGGAGFPWDKVAIWIVVAGTAFLAVLWVRLALRSRREAQDARRRHEERMAKRKDRSADGANDSNGGGPGATA